MRSKHVLPRSRAHPSMLTSNKLFTEPSGHLLLSDKQQMLPLLVFSRHRGGLLTCMRPFAKDCGLRGNSALQAAQVTPHQSAQVNAMLSTTWFQVRHHSESLTQTASGTRPGDSVADVLFAFLMSRYLHPLREAFIHHGLQTQYKLKWLPFEGDALDDFPSQDIIQACWVDDLVILLQAETNATLLAKIKVAMSLVQDIAAQFGLHLNYGPNKTACVMKLRGPGTNAMWQQILEESDHQRPAIHFACQSLLAPGRLDIVADYVYLGQLQDQRGHPACEIRRSFINVRTANALLNKGVFRSKHMPYATKSMLFKALVLSKLHYGAGAWQHMNIHTARSWHQQLCAIFAKLAPTQRKGPHTTNLDLIADCQMSHPSMIIAAQRMSLFDRLLQTDMLELWAILQNQDQRTGWFALVQQDIRLFLELQPNHPLSQLVEEDRIDLVAKYSFANPKALTKLCRKSQQLYHKTLELWKQFRTFQSDMRDICENFQVKWTLADVPRPESLPFQCDQCTAVFASFKGLCSHAYQVHKVVNLVQKYTASNTCRACLRKYHSRTEVVHHLKYATSTCLIKLIATVPALTDDDLAEALETEKAQRRKQKAQERNPAPRFPVCLTAGPQQPWPWQIKRRCSLQETQDIPDDTVSLESPWVQDVLTTAAESDVEATLLVLQQMPYTEAYDAILQQAFQTCAYTSCADALDSHMTLQEATALWQDIADPRDYAAHRPVAIHKIQQQLGHIRTSRQSQTAHEMPLTVRRQLLHDQLWLECNAPFQIRQQLATENKKTYVMPMIRQPDWVTDPIFLYVFAGRRRPGDYQSHAEHCFQQYQIQGRVLLLDLAISPKHDVSQPQLTHQLTCWIRSGIIAAILVAPPCETWSEARFNEIAGVATPRPLRSSTDPFCIDGLNTQELEQLSMSNFLLFVALKLLWLAYLCCDHVS